MNEKDQLRALAERFEDMPFYSVEALDVLDLDRIREYLAHPGSTTGGASRMMAAHLKDLGCRRLSRGRTRNGYPWMLPDEPVQMARAGICRHCLRSVHNLLSHEPTCALRAIPKAVPNSYVEETNHVARQAADLLAEKEQVYIARAGAHAMADPRPGQRWAREGVTDETVAHTMYLIEAGMPVRRSYNGTWQAPMLGRRQMNHCVNEMIRVGLLTHVQYSKAGEVVDKLVPAKVHWTTGNGLAACEFPGDGRPPMRTRLLTEIELTDCLDCEDVAEKIRHAL